MTFLPVLQPSTNNADLVEELELTPKKEEMIKCCLACHRVLELYKQRNIALTFQQPNTVRKLQELKYRSISKWNLGDCMFVVQVYKEAVQNIRSDSRKVLKLQ